MRNPLIHIEVGNVAHLRASMGRDGAEGLGMTYAGFDVAGAWGLHPAQYQRR